MRLRIASIILAVVPFLASVGFLIALVSSTGPEGLGVLIAFLYTCVAFTVFGAVAVVLAFLRQPPSAVDIPARVASIASLVIFAPPGGFGLILGIMMMFPPAVNA